MALLEATSGRRFEELIISEWRELGDDTRDLYAIAAVASALRFGLSRDELLLAVGDASNATLASIDALQRRHLIVADPAGGLRVRHRVIAEVLMRALSADGLLNDVITGLAIAAASKVGPATPRGHRHYRRIRALMNHDWLTLHVGAAGAKHFYEELELMMTWDHHYWLQRGTCELEQGNLPLAENFLSQSMSLEPDDPLVRTEFGYLRLRQAVISPSSAESRALLEEGFGLLRDAISDRQGSDPHQYYIYGSQGLSWLQRGDVTAVERTQLLKELAELVEEGRRAHLRDEDMRRLLVDIQNARLGHGP